MASIDDLKSGWLLKIILSLEKITDFLIKSPRRIAGETRDIKSNKS